MINKGVNMKEKPSILQIPALELGQVFNPLFL
jgi:hypothetical protein